MSLLAGAPVSPHSPTHHQFTPRSSQQLSNGHTPIQTTPTITQSSQCNDSSSASSSSSSTTQPPLVMKTAAHNMQFMEFWPSTLKHKTELLQEQLDVGMYSIKRYAFYLDKVVQIRRPTLLELKKATEYEGKEKSSKAAKDAMTQYVTNYNMTQNVMSSVIDLELIFLNTIDSQIVQVITGWLKSAEKRLDVTVKKLAGVFVKYKALLVKITRARSECHKQWSSLQAAWKESEKCEQVKLTKKNGMKDYEVAFTKYSKEVTKTYALFNNFEVEVKEANEQQRCYWEEELPQCVKEYEQLETERLQTYGLAMEAFRNAQYEFFYRSMESSRVLDGTTIALDGTQEMKNWTEGIIQQCGYPHEPDYIMDYLPCEYTRVQQGDDLQHLLSIDLSVALQHRQHEQQKSHLTRTTSLHGNGNSNSGGANLQINFTRPSYAHAVGKALFDYPQNDTDDLMMSSGEYIAILDMPLPLHGEESAWWVGAKFDHSTGRLLQKGIIPSNYVTFDF